MCVFFFSFRIDQIFWIQAAMLLTFIALLISEALSRVRSFEDVFQTSKMIVRVSESTLAQATGKQPGEGNGKPAGAEVEAEVLQI